MTALAAPVRRLRPTVAHPGTAAEAGDVARAVAALRGWRLVAYYHSTAEGGWVGCYYDGRDRIRVPLARAALWL